MIIFSPSLSSWSLQCIGHNNHHGHYQLHGGGGQFADFEYHHNHLYHHYHLCGGGGGQFADFPHFVHYHEYHNHHCDHLYHLHGGQIMNIIIVILTIIINFMEEVSLQIILILCITPSAIHTAAGGHIMKIASNWMKCICFKLDRVFVEGLT